MPDPIVIVGGGQSRLAAARSVKRAGLRPVVLEASARPAGSWPDYYDSLAAFSPARYSAMPGAPFPGDPDHYPRRDEVADYRARWAGHVRGRAAACRRLPPPRAVRRPARRGRRGGQLGDPGRPRAAGGISTTHFGLAYVGLEFQRSFASNTLRGVSHDADHVVRPLAAWVRGAAATVLEAA